MLYVGTLRLSITTVGSPDVAWACPWLQLTRIYYSFFRSLLVNTNGNKDNGCVCTAALTSVFLAIRQESALSVLSLIGNGAKK